ncbi:glycoprotein [Ohlsdorf virus]|uniref:Glycoprotein n=1 Tax=Ohlsdorf virus TaxID=2040592 RepID=A0A291I325_9RHAB|nr:glycoprotein [Ohlsdorf virus]ATG83561.1 glycoprotein [Ohlsdorf virus]
MVNYVKFPLLNMVSYFIWYSPDVLCQSILFPTTNTIDWIPLDPNDISCDFPYYPSESNSNLKIRGRSPILQTKYEINGFLCNAITTVTSCDKGFFGGETVTHSEYRPPLEFKDCENAIRKFKSGTLDTYEHPPPSCSWMKKSDNLKSTVLVQERTVLFDPYSNQLISSWFADGKCEYSPCSTVKQNMKWISDVNHPPECISDHLDEVIMFLTDSKSTNSYTIWSPDIHITDFNEICTMTYCSVNGFLFPNGEWVGINKNDIPSIPKLGEFLYNIKECNSSTHLHIKEHRYINRETEQTEFSILLSVECSKTKDDLLSQTSINRVQLQSLTPRIPGRHRVYRFHNNTLQMGYSEYKWVRTEKSVTFPFIKIILANGKEVRWPYWYLDPNNDIIEGPNGLFIKNKKLAYALSDLINYNRSILINGKISYDIPHVHLPKVSPINNIISTRDFNTINDDNLISVIRGWSPFHTITQSIFWLSAIVMVILILKYTVPLLINKIKNRRKSIDQDTELSVFYKP